MRGDLTEGAKEGMKTYGPQRTLMRKMEMTWWALAWSSHQGPGRVMVPQWVEKEAVEEPK